MRTTGRPLTRAQRGATLVIALIMLVVLTLFGISAISTGVVNLRIARNTQMASEAQLAAQRVIDTQISSLATFTAPTASTSTVDASGGGTAYSVAFAVPDCIYIKQADGYSYPPPGGTSIAPKDTTWRLVATATDAATGARLTVQQGVKVRLPTSATCP
jgi:type II secretory pathway pseudopilin PulG